MIRNGRRLKRYLGLRRKLIPNTFGGIENISPGLISGWVCEENSNFTQVKLVSGNIVLAVANIDQIRTDVNELYDFQESPGFVIYLPVELPQIDFSKEIKVIAEDPNLNKSVQLYLLKKKKSTNQVLNDILNSELLGTVGNIDGYNDKYKIHGWVAKKGQLTPSYVWLQASGMTPLMFLANEIRANTKERGYTEKSGFSIFIDELPKTWSGKHVFCSFDKEGNFPLPSLFTIVLPENSSTLDLKELNIDDNVTVINNKNFEKNISSAPAEHKDHWRSLENFRLYLEKIEEEIDIWEYSSNNKLSSKNKKLIFSKFKKFFLNNFK